MTFAPLLLAVACPLHAQLLATGNHRLYQTDASDIEEAGDHFGATLAAGDFDGDGYADLAIGTPEEDVGSVVDAGAVYIVYGSPAGLGKGSRPPLVLHQDVALVQDVAETDDLFGAALTVGNFNGDSFDDLAVGVPGEEFDIFFGEEGAVHTFPGGPGGLVAAADLLIHRGLFTDRQDARFGSSLTACDRNPDGRDELVVGEPGRMGPGGGLNDPAVWSFPGSATGISVASASLVAFSSTVDRLGAALACADLDGQPGDDILVGRPLRYNMAQQTGAYLVFEADGGLTEVFGTQSGGRLGDAVAVGWFEGPGRPSIGLVGEPGWDASGQNEAGRGIVHDFAMGGPELVTQNTVGVPDASEPFDHFGLVLAVGDFDGDGFDDAVLAVPDENLNDGLPNQKLDAGAVHVLAGSATGLVPSGSQYWTWDAIGFGSLANDHFGGAVAAGDFDDNGVDDLAIAAPHANWNVSDTGIVQILYGRPQGWIFDDRFETGNASRWAP